MVEQEMEDGGGGWVPDTPGKVNLIAADLICTDLDFGCGNESNSGDGVEGFVSRIPEESERKVVVHDPLASWNGIEFTDLLARADMGKIEPLLDFSSDSVRCRNSRFVLPGNGDVAVIVGTWDSNKLIPESQGGSVWDTTGAFEDKLQTDQTQNSAVSITTVDEQLCPEQGTKQIPDLNATPQQKPKKRKHRPKVVIEGRSKKPRKEMSTLSIPKSTQGTEKRKYVRKKKSEDTDNKTSKRKYVRKKGPPKSLSTPTAEGVEMTELNGSMLSTKSCSKVLDFDSDSQANNNRHQHTSGAKENPILLSDTDTDHEQELTNKSGSRNGLHQQRVRSEKREIYNNLSRSVDAMCRSHMRVCNALYSPVRKYQQLSKNGFKHTPACVNLAVHHKGEEHSSTTSITSSTVTFARNNGKLEEWWHCNPMAPPTSSTTVQVSISNEKEVTATRPAQVANTEISSVLDFPGNQASLHNHIEGEGKPCTTLTASKDRAHLARRNRIQKRKQEQNSLSQGVNMGQLINGSHSIPIALHVDAMWEFLISVDDIVERLKALDVNRETKTSHQRCNALVPFEICYGNKLIHDSRRNRREERKELVLYNHNGILIPFDSVHNKKRRPRAKVDLDEETSRVWRLLLENINSQGVDGTDKEKEKWWENERKVFSGRANSFIARMHLVQGDRRFSKWKGSVVDSVVGVFLTQNVSDHLSSSAFMSLAARFPLKSNSNDEQYHKEGSCSENTVHVMHSDDSAPLNSELSNDPMSDQVSSVSNSEHIEQKAVSSCEGASNSGAMSSTDESICKISGFRSEQQKFIETIGIQLNHDGSAEVSCVAENQQSQLDEVVSSQSSAITHQSSLESLPSQTGDQNELHSDRNVNFDPASVSLPEAYRGSTTFLELLQMVGCTGNQGGSLRCCNEEATVKDVQNGVDDVRLHNQLKNEMDRSSSIELGIISSDNGVSSTRFDLTEIESLKTPAKDIMPLDVSTDEGSHFNKEASLNCMPPNAKITTNKALSAFEDKINKSHGTSGQYDGSDMSSIMIPVDQDNIEVGKRGFRSLNMTTNLTDTTESIKSSKGPKDQASNTVVNKTYTSDRAFYESNIESLKAKRRRVGKDIDHRFDWEGLRKETQVNGKARAKTPETMDSLDYEAVRSAEVNDIAYTIRDRGMNNVLAGRIKDFLNRLVNEHGSIDLEWLRDVPADQAKEYLLSIRGLGLKSVECVRLLTLHHLAFPVDTNVGRIAVRLGWVPLQPLPESLQLHLLEMYPVQESIQKYLWPRLCKLDQKTLYELHYQMITFGKVFCTKSKPNCNSCPMRGECRHFASAFASARLALPGLEEKRIVPSIEQRESTQNFGQVPEGLSGQVPLLPHIVCPQQDPQDNLQISQSSESQSRVFSCEPIIEEPKSPEIECVQIEEKDIEDGCFEESDEIPEIKLNIEEFTQSLQNYIHKNMELEEGDVSRALIALTPEAASIPVPKLKNVSMLRTEHHVYELPDSHPLLEGLDKREPDDPCSYLLAIWTPGETANSVQPPKACTSGKTHKLCDKETCFSCNSSREANSHTVRGTLLIPCRTAMRGSFPLNGTYFQVNEVFADHASSLNPMNIPRKWLWNLPRRTVYFGTSIPTIFKGLSTEGIQQCFWRGYVCVRGFDQKSRAPRPLLARLHFPASKVSKTRGKPSGE